jgi:glycogen debranching enzyme
VKCSLRSRASRSRSPHCESERRQRPQAGERHRRHGSSAQVASLLPAKNSYSSARRGSDSLRHRHHRFGTGRARGCNQRGKTWVPHCLIERAEIANTIHEYQLGKLVMAEPRRLPLRSHVEFAEGSREAVLEAFRRALEESGQCSQGRRDGPSTRVRIGSGSSAIRPSFPPGTSFRHRGDGGAPQAWFRG